MATTSLWHIKGKLKDLIDYVENPNKTVASTDELQDFFNVFSYVQKPEKTEDGEYVTAINCLKGIALQQMILTKKQYFKDDGYVAWHGYQSFKPGELSAEKSHEIGVALAKEMWGDRFQIIVTTHLDQNHLHNHFCFNSVSFRDGGKYNYSKVERQRFMEVSDRLCREHNLTVIKHPHKAPSRAVWIDEKSGKPTRYNVYRKDVWDAIEGSRTIELMKKYLVRLGYQIDFSGAHWKIKLPQYEHYTRLDTLDSRLTPQFIMNNIGRHTAFGNKPPIVRMSPYAPAEIWVWKPNVRTTRIRALYLSWCYELGALPKGTSYAPTSPFMCEEIRKMDQISKETLYMTKNNIETLDDLHADMEKNQAQLYELVAYRTKLQNKIRRADPKEKETLRNEKADVSEQIKLLRQNIKCDRGIERRSEHIDACYQRMHDNEVRARQEKQNRTKENAKER